MLTSVTVSSLPLSAQREVSSVHTCVNGERTAGSAAEASPAVAKASEAVGGPSNSRIAAERGRDACELASSAYIRSPGKQCCLCGWMDPLRELL